MDVLLGFAVAGIVAVVDVQVEHVAVAVRKIENAVAFEFRLEFMLVMHPDALDFFLLL